MPQVNRRCRIDVTPGNIRVNSSERLIIHLKARAPIRT
jgi:hypothetical protein